MIDWITLADLLFAIRVYQLDKPTQWDRDQPSKNPKVYVFTCSDGRLTQDPGPKGSRILEAQCVPYLGPDGYPEGHWTLNGLDLCRCFEAEDQGRAVSLLSLGYQQGFTAAVNHQGDPVPMLLFCPHCHVQHIDCPEPETGWTNPPHRQHKCKACGHLWRPAMILTTGVEALPALPARPSGLFYVQDTRQVVGNSAVWWGPDGSGYTTHIDQAGRYPKQGRHWRKSDRLWPVEVVDRLWSQHVDQQDLDHVGQTFVQPVPRGHCNRCDRCGFPFAPSSKEGCRPGDCSVRPLPELRTTCPGCATPYVRQEDGPGAQFVQGPVPDLAYEVNAFPAQDPVEAYGRDAAWSVHLARLPDDDPTIVDPGDPDEWDRVEGYQGSREPDLQKLPPDDDTEEVKTKDGLL